MKKRILIVEDEEKLRRVLELQLMSAGFDVDKAATAEEGLKLGNKLGVDREAMREALVAASAGNWALASRIEEQPMPWAEKDMTIVLKEADAVRMSVPLCGVVKEVVKTVKFERNWPTPSEPEPAGSGSRESSTRCGVLAVHRGVVAGGDNPP